MCTRNCFMADPGVLPLSCCLLGRSAEGFVVRAALAQAQTMLESLFPSSADVVESCLRRVKVIEGCNLCNSMAVLAVVQDTVGAAALLGIMDGMYDLAQQ